ncbi:MAG: tetratricopeptide repeat protein, partial [Burkholderiales bacterium]
DERGLAVVRYLGDNGARGASRWLAACALAIACATALAQDSTTALTPERRARLQWEAGYVLHQLGEYERAIEAYRASIADRPTAEAHTFLGWSLSYLGRIEEAIAHCKIAIRLDPDFGNPYNDIGVYLLNTGKPEEAVPWLEKAIGSKRYCCYQFPHSNLGRILLIQGKVEEARRSFERALEYDPHYLPALLGLEFLRRGGLQGL